MRPRLPIPPSILAAAALSLLTAGCGGSSPNTATTRPSGLVAYSHCMRSHGIPTFPDPTGSEGIPKNEVPVSNPQFRPASTDCQHLMPSTGLGPQTTAHQTSTRVADGISFARCIRAHGFPTFPDPTPTGQLTHVMLANAAINLRQPALQQAADACASVTHGLITKATIASFIAGH